MTDELPPLPTPFMELCREIVPAVYAAWATQMQDYARAAIAAHEAKQTAEPVGHVMWAANVPGTFKEVLWLDPIAPPVGTALYTHPAPKREPLTKVRTLSPEQIERHKMTVKDAPYDSELLLVSTVRRLLGHGITKDTP